MNKFFGALVLTAAACTAPAFAGTSVSVRIGEPGFYGQLEIGGYQPRLIYREPVLVERRYRNVYPRYVTPVYVRVPTSHSRNWSRYCSRYDACGRPVYFVRDEWYRDVYSPRYRNEHSRDWRPDRRDDRHGRRNDHRDDRRGGRH